MKIKQKFPFQWIFAFTIFVYIMLDCRYSLPMNTLLRWIFPALLLILPAIKTGRLVIKQDFAYYMVLIVFGAASIYSPYPSYSLQRLVSFIIVTSSYIVYYTYLQKKGRLESIFATIGIQFVVYELCNFIFLDYSSRRARGITGNPNSLGVWSNVAFVFAVYFYNKSHRMRYKLASAMIMVMSVITAISSGSRTYTICILLNVVVALAILLPRNKRVIYLFFISIIAFFGWEFIGEFLVNLPGIRRLFEEGTTRDMLWEAGVFLWKQHPIQGWGYGVSQKLNNFALLGHLLEEGELGFAFHNSYLTVMIETGVIGIVAVAFYIVRVMVKGIVAYRRQNSPELLLVLSLIVTMLLCFWGGSAMTSVGSTEGFFFWGLLIWLTVYNSNMESDVGKVRTMQTIFP